MSVDTGLLADLEKRGLIAQRTAESELDEHLATSRRLYCGFDPTADSLHIGSLVPLLMLKRFQQAGHVPIALVGGSTGLIGDPSFKAAERKLNGPETVQLWCERLRAQISRFVDFDNETINSEARTNSGATNNGAILVNNYDWAGDMSVLDFLRDIGKHFSVNSMVQKESVKQRIEREGSGISFTEFSYLLLQSWDFAELYKQHDCSLQIGGSDQWGNITGGIDLARRMHSGQVYGLTMPLVTKSDGTKFGKTESGTIWLDPAKTSPYAFYQFWLQVADADVYRFLKYFTFIGVEEIDEIERLDAEREGRPEAQRILAEQVTRMVHGADALQAAERITQALFSGSLDELSESDFEQLGQDGLPTARLEDFDLESIPLTTLFTEVGLAKNGKQVKDALSRKAVSSNGVDLSWDDNMKASEIFTQASAKYGKYHLLKLGKKNYQMLIL